jgi:ATP-dependent RNA helicase MSS116
VRNSHCAGLDYPDVTLVVQVGTPFNLNLNTHRIGRTARGGRVGEALLITLPFESKSISGMARRYGYTKESMKYTLDLGDDGLSRVRECMLKHKVLRSHAESAYLSFVAYYTEYGSRDISAADILHAAEAFAAEIGLTELPAMSERLAISLDKR